MKAVRIIFFLLIVFLAMPEFVLGVPALLNGIRAHGDVWSVRHDYFTDAAITLVAGLLAVGFAAWGAFWPGKTNWLRFAVAAGIVLLMAVAIPGWYMEPSRHGASRVHSKMRELQDTAESWAQAHGTYPMAVNDLAPAPGPASDSAPSPYRRAGKNLPFEFAFAGNATGPTLRAERPGVLYYNVTADGRHYWITGTALAKPVGSEVVMVTEGSSGPPLVLTGALEPPAPVPPSKPGKKR